MHILLTGATGLVGGRLVPALLQAGHTLTLVSRKAHPTAPAGVQYAVWDGTTLPALTSPVDAVLNLAGAGIADQRWTPQYKQVILQSRVQATRACVAFIRQAAQPPQVFLSASAVGYYGPRTTDTPCQETDGPGSDFLGHVGKAWEAAAEGAGVRTVIPRIGIVLAHEGGAFPKLLAPFKLYAGGPIGTGRQGFPWIHIDDVVGAMLHLLATPTATGPVNLVAPERHSNASFGQVVGKALHRPSGLPVPTLAIKLLLGESAMLVTEGQFVASDTLAALGYTFKYPTAEAALAELIAH
ncbi:MAG: TIGR01777 family oxidoreductase [Bacteroidia bacterium]|nr:TIGR01777 family oxidoreductase [Bacteroidia bacterium]